MFDDLEFTRFVNSSIILLASIGKQTRMYCCCDNQLQEKKKMMNWVLSPGGKQIIKSGKTGIYFLKKIENNLVVNTIKKPDLNSKIFTITQESN